MGMNEMNHKVVVPGVPNPRDTLHHSSRRLFARFGRFAALAFLPIPIRTTPARVE